MRIEFPCHGIQSDVKMSLMMARAILSAIRDTHIIFESEEFNNVREYNISKSIYSNLEEIDL